MNRLALCLGVFLCGFLSAAAQDSLNITQRRLMLQGLPEFTSLKSSDGLVAARSAGGVSFFRYEGENLEFLRTYSNLAPDVFDINRSLFVSASGEGDSATEFSVRIARAAFPAIEIGRIELQSERPGFRPLFLGLTDSILFIATPHGFRIVNLAQPSRPVETASYDELESIIRCEVRNEKALLYSERRIFIVDIYEVEIECIVEFQQYSIYCAAMRDSLLAVSLRAEADRLYLYNVGQPENPVAEAAVNVPFREVQFFDEKVIGITRSGGLASYKVDEQDRLIVEANYTNFPPLSASGTDGELFVAAISSPGVLHGLVGVDVSTRTPELIWSQVTGAANRQIWGTPEGGLIYRPAAVRPVPHRNPEFNFPPQALSLNFDNPLYPEVDFVVEPRRNSPTAAFAIGEEARFLGNTTMTVFNPIDGVIGQYPGWFESFALLDTILYASRGPQIAIFNVANPRQPERLNEVRFADEGIFELALLPEYLLAGGIDGFYIFSLDSPLDPEVVLFLQRNVGSMISGDSISFRFESINVRSYLRYRRIRPDGVMTEGSSMALRGFGKRLGLSGDYLAIFQNRNLQGVRQDRIDLYDVSNLQEYRHCGYYYFPDTSICDIALVDRYIYAARQNDVLILDCSAAMELNSAPRFRSAQGVIEASELSEITVRLVAEDADGDELELTALDLPRGAGFANQGGGEGLFRWETDYQSAGEYQPRFVVSDGEWTDSLALFIRIRNVNRPPVFNRLVAPPNDFIWSPNRFELAFRWTAALDPDGEAMRYHLLMKEAEEGDNRSRLWFDAGFDTTAIIRWGEVEELLGRVNVVWEVWALDGEDSVRCETPFRLLTPNGLEDDPLPGVFTLYPAFPNPFNSQTAVPYYATGKVSLGLSCFDLAGRQIWTERFETQRGKGRILLDGAGLASGSYLLRVSSAAGDRVIRINCLK